MAKTKTELESDRVAYSTLMRKAVSAHDEGDFQSALAHAVAACEFADGMMQFERRYLDRAEFESVDSIDYVLLHAPLLFDFESLDKLAALLKAQRRIEKNTTADLAANLQQARERMKDAHRLWNLIEQPNGDGNLGREEVWWHGIAEIWKQMGILKRAAPGNSSLRFTTQMSDEVFGRCPACGVNGKAAKERFLEADKCPKCGAEAQFVFLLTDDASGGAL